MLLDDPLAARQSNLQPRELFTYDQDSGLDRCHPDQWVEAVMVGISAIRPPLVSDDYSTDLSGFSSVIIA